MDDGGNQIEVPASFSALFTTPGGHRLTEPVAVVRERYELCEDLAQMLTAQAAARLDAAGSNETEVLRTMEQALAVEGSPVSPAEAQWVVRRLAELMDWAAPGGDSAS